MHNFEVPEGFHRAYFFSDEAFLEIRKTVESRNIVIYDNGPYGVNGQYYIFQYIDFTLDEGSAKNKHTYTVSYDPGALIAIADTAHVLCPLDQNAIIKLPVHNKYETDGHWTPGTGQIIQPIREAPCTAAIYSPACASTDLAYAINCKRGEFLPEYRALSFERGYLKLTRPEHSPVYQICKFFEPRFNTWTPSQYRPTDSE